MLEEQKLVKDLTRIMTQKEMADKVGCAPASVWRWLTNPDCKIIVPHIKALRALHRRNQKKIKQQKQGDTS